MKGEEIGYWSNANTVLHSGLDLKAQQAFLLSLINLPKTLKHL